MALLLASAFRKLLFCEAAYGYTVARLFAKGFMIALALSLVVLALELLARIDVHRLVRRQAALAATMLLVFTYWNHEAWITRQNVARFEASGRFDLDYAARQLSRGAVPAALGAARVIGGNDGRCLRHAILHRWESQASRSPRWFERNLVEHAAQRAIGRTTEGMAERGDPSRMPAAIASTGNT